MRSFVFGMGLVAGACATAAVQSSAAPPASDASAAREQPDGPRLVIPIEAAERRVSPSGTGEITILARGDNAFLGKLQLAAGGGVPLHRDETEEYIHVLSGHGTITIDGTDFPIAAGTTIYMPPNAEVKYANGDEPLVAIQVFAGPWPAAKYDAWAPAP